MARKSKRRRAIEEQLGVLSPVAVPEAVSVLKGIEGSLPEGISAVGVD